MRAVVQRVSRASVKVGDELTGEIGKGLLVLLGVGQDDSQADADYLAEKIAGLRIFEDEAGKMNLSVMDAGGAVLAVSQFTLFGDVRRGEAALVRCGGASGAGQRALRLFRAAGSRPGIALRNRTFPGNDGGRADKCRSGHDSAGFEESVLKTGDHGLRRYLGVEPSPLGAS